MLVGTTPLLETVLDCAAEVHKAIGPGLPESAYDQCFMHELALRDLPFIRQVPVPVHYKGARLHCGCHVDFIVEGGLLVKLACVDRLLPIHHARMMTFLKLLELNQGLLVNFNANRLADGVKTFVL
jgi:GxxExxY protein